MANDEQEISVWWIDDDHEVAEEGRAGEVAALEADAGEPLSIDAIHPAIFEERIGSQDPLVVPHLLLIDYRLNTRQLPGKTMSVFARDGVRLAGAVRGIPEFHDIPVYLISRVITEEQSGSLDEAFDWVLSYQQLTAELKGRFLLSDASDHREVFQAYMSASQAEGKSAIEQSLISAIVQLVAAPDSTVDSLREVVRHMVTPMIRSEAHLDAGDLKLAPSQPLAIARWIRSTLQRLRGPLIDNLSAATTLGATEEYFEQSIKGQYDGNAIEYRGVFCSTSSMTLWKEELINWVSSKSQSIELSSPSSLARTSAELFDVPPEHQATCRVCGKLWPECIAHDEDDNDMEAAVHWRCSREDTDSDTPYGFDVPRVFTTV